MQPNKEFAPQYDRNDEGWILFPRDSATSPRSLLFPPEVMNHPAKYNFALIESIIEYTTNDGDTVMDIMAGTGSIMLAAARGRKVVCVELEELYQTMLYESLNYMKEYIPDIGNRVTILCGDCRDFLPIPVNHIIFSPPYAQILTTRKGPTRDSTKALAGIKKDGGGAWTPDYTANPRNLGRLNKFLYNQAMERIYKLCYDSIIPPGTMTVVIKDYMKQGRRVFLSSWVIKVCKELGFENVDWFKWNAPGTGFLKLWRSRGYSTVGDEDILVFRRNK